jgi:putative membrane protein insertion efficiency factor
MITELINKIFSLPKKVLLIVIKSYQKLLSPDHSFWAKKIYPQGYCKFYPTCSEYSYQVIKKNGIIRGVFSSIWRVLRCNPWNEGGVDQP